MGILAFLVWATDFSTVSWYPYWGVTSCVTDGVPDPHPLSFPAGSSTWGCSPVCALLPLPVGAGRSCISFRASPLLPSQAWHVCNQDMCALTLVIGLVARRERGGYRGGWDTVSCGREASALSPAQEITGLQGREGSLFCRLRELRGTWVCKVLSTSTQIFPC